MDKLFPQEMFDYSVKALLAIEGPFSNDKSDPGGATNYGISLRFLKSAGIDIDGDGDTDLDDILALDEPKSREIYRQYFWNKYHYSRINNEDIAKKIFDMTVNMGASRSHKIAQISVNRVRKTPIQVDGVLGPQSFGAINSLILDGKYDELYDELKKNAAHFYVNLVADKPELKVFLKGWLRRAAK